ncbi:hypothetical protein Pint_02198 [Pistacia integerrima]|uniref:Uncharacterized protein n=1 Tax=Pistacia integerrima TaxID=434235 RepID=A0ACC0ZM69_9ROSI|nr:hypothetical protein Pint_02198 [Pistacia integerrima]
MAPSNSSFSSIIFFFAFFLDSFVSSFSSFSVSIDYLLCQLL